MDSVLIAAPRFICFLTDPKKKELVGNFKNGGREWRPQGEPEAVKVHDFADKELRPGRALTRVYDLANNIGWVNLGISHDTAAFAVESIRRWWQRLGQDRYTQARRLLITADCGGSNGARLRLWKVELQKLARELGLEISVCHLPPGTSKWNKIEHRLFAFISQNWPGQAAHRLGHHHQPDQRHKHQRRTQGLLRSRHQQLPQRHRRQRCRDAGPQHQASRVPWRVELHPHDMKERCYFFTDP